MRLTTVTVNLIIFSTSLILGSSDGRVLLERGEWFHVESKEVIKERSENQRLSMVATDLRVRTFTTIYSPEIARKI